MSELALIIAGLFLPLFPLSMVFNEAFQRLGSRRLRGLLLLVWPQIGIVIAHLASVEIPTWIIFWALFTAILYGFRALALREVGVWTSFIATSAWVILWLTIDGSTAWSKIALYGLALSVPLVMLVMLSGELEKRFGAAYTGLYGGLALNVPRLSGVLVMVILAVVATPLFPGFSVMMAAIIESSSQSFVAALIAAVIWIFWCWAGARLIQGIIVGPASDESVEDLSTNSVWAYTAILILLVLSGIYSIGNLS